MSDDKNKLNLLLIRKHYTLDSTLGEIFQIDYENAKTIHLAYTLEDASLTHKIYGESCIKPGKYKVQNTYSNRFNRVLPLLLDVPEFKGIRIHGGNSNKDTLGCILVGANWDIKAERIWNCAIPLQLIMDLVHKYDETWLEII